MENNKHKIGIVGLGPVGMILAVHLKSYGCEVAICDHNKSKMNLIRNSGIELNGFINKSEFFSYNYSSIVELLDHDINILIASVKSYDADNMLDLVEKYKHKDIFLVCAQDGIDISFKYTSHFNESQILRLVPNFAGVMQAPNVINVSFFTPPNYIASLDDTNTNVSTEIASLFTATGLQTESMDSFTIASQIWRKAILISAVSSICGLSNLTIKEAMSNSDTVEIIEQSILESVEVANAEGIKFEPNFVKMCMRELKNAGDHTPTLAVDIQNNRETEIDYFCGKIVEYGRKHYIQTPLNLTFTNLVNAVTMKYLNEKHL